MDDATDSLTNKQIARMLGWKDYQTDAGYTVWLSRDGVKWYWPPDYLKRLDLCLCDILPEIVRRGYKIELCFESVTSVNEMYLFEPDNCLATERWNIDPTNPSSIARAICEAYRVVMEEKS